MNQESKINKTNVPYVDIAIDIIESTKPFSLKKFNQIFEKYYESNSNELVGYFDLQFERHNVYEIRLNKLIGAIGALDYNVTKYSKACLIISENNFYILFYAGMNFFQLKLTKTHLEHNSQAMVPVENRSFKGLYNIHTKNAISIENDELGYYYFGVSNTLDLLDNNDHFYYSRNKMNLNTLFNK